MDLHADCSRCLALCCVALPFAVSADFAIDKKGGEPCPKLLPDLRCGIHDRLRDEGFRGCSAFDCFGAGQKVAQETFGGRDWRRHPELARPMFAVLPVMRQLHELLWYLEAALALPEAEGVRSRLQGLRAKVEAATHGSPDRLAGLDVTSLRRAARPLLDEVSAQVRATVPDPRKAWAGADLVGAELAGADLRGADLRGAALIAADLSGADLRSADLRGADLRDADLRAADLTGSLFLTRPQLEAARGDAATALPGALPRPAHWR